MISEVSGRGSDLTVVDELNTWVRRRGDGGSLDAGKHVKPMLARGELHLIGATKPSTNTASTLKRDAALERGRPTVLSRTWTRGTPFRSCAGLRERLRCSTG